MLQYYYQGLDYLLPRLYLFMHAGSPLSSEESDVVSLVVSWYKIHTTSQLVLVNCSLNGISCPCTYVYNIVEKEKKL